MSVYIYDIYTLSLMYDFSKLKFRKSRFLKILDTLIPFSAFEAQTF